MTKKKGRRRKRPTKKEFEYMYYKMDLTAEQMANRFKVTTQTIYNWSNQFRKETNERNNN